MVFCVILTKELLLKQSAMESLLNTGMAIMAGNVFLVDDCMWCNVSISKNVLLINLAALFMLLQCRDGFC